MKVKLTNSKLLKSYAAVISVISTILSLALIFVSLPEEPRIRSRLALVFLLFLVIIYILMWIHANAKRRVVLSINGTKVVVKEGDIFTQKNTLKIIPFNEYFDTQVDDVIISSSSLHGQFILKYYARSEKLQEVLFEELSRKNSEKYIAFENVKREVGNKTSYRLGTCVRIGNYALLAFSKFDKDNRAYLDSRLLWECLINMWEELDIIHNQQEISLPLLGTGITRKLNMSLSEQEILELIIVSLKASGVHFGWNTPVNIVIHSSNADEIDFYGITDYSD